MRKAGNAQLAGFAIEDIGVEGELAVAAFDERRSRARSVRAAVAGIDFAAYALDRLARNAIVDGVHHTADRVAAVQQRRRSAHDFDALDRERVLRHGVIVRQRRCVVRRDAVLQQPNAVAVHAADDRAADHRAVGRRGDAGQSVERFAEGIRPMQRERVAVEHAGRRDQRGRAQRIRCHEHRREGGVFARIRLCVAVLAACERGEQQHAQGNERALSRHRIGEEPAGHDVVTPIV